MITKASLDMKILMMRRHSKLGNVALALALLGSMGVPTAAAAFTLPTIPMPRFQDATAAVQQVEGVCLRLDALERTIVSRITASTAAYEKSAAMREARAIDVLIAKDTPAESRKTSDRNLSEHLAGLREKAGGDVLKKQAVAAFGSEVRAATEVRRKSIDAAARAYRDGVAAASRQRAREVAAISDNLRTELTGVVDSMATRCREGVDPQRIRTELIAALSETEGAYRAKLADRSAFVMQVSALASARSAAITEADAAFATSLNASSQKLRSVLQ